LGTALRRGSASGSRSDEIAPTSACKYFVLKRYPSKKNFLYKIIEKRKICEWKRKKKMYKL
jgi:hypothetical protein